MDRLRADENVQLRIVEVWRFQGFAIQAYLQLFTSERINNRNAETIERAKPITHTNCEH
ncbi:predicted protein [Sclerotinia sclerotiorum 1980 UF-70]|uniref:Uncharacterized protein n=1 Tax=Sclerotinia sclerotiorum (strain ATCC 18683 / 1980 / Ss-1) TaxID=665079 RepID=A7ENC2_SCLS1|nr:predicted protein [Sclerotinia sclerotiorum 1980 UF-70]EDO04338.1 predicted protein [Sclerotinia sclerotiorum 1980 UF-70]